MLPPPPALARVHEAMSKKISFDFVETPLRDVIAFVSHLGALTVVLDPQAVEGKALTVTLKVDDMRLESALAWALRPAKLQSVVMDEAVFVTTPECSRALRPTACLLYDPRHLIGPRRTSADLEKTIRATCQGHAEWAPSHRVAELQGRFIIHTTAAVHAAIQGLLVGAVRREAAVHPRKPPEAPQPPPRPAAPLDLEGLKKGQKIEVFLKGGTRVVGKLYSASPRHVSVMVGDRLQGIPLGDVEKIEQGGRTFVPSP
jgi:hypothetical protein